MQTLNSMFGLRKASLVGTGVLAIAAIFLLVAPMFASAAGTTVNVNASASYGKSVAVSGTVSPAPGVTSGATVQVFNPSGVLVLSAGDVTVNPSTGAYSINFTAGGTSNWVNGTYSATVTWAASFNSQAYQGTGTFAYGSVGTSSSSSSSSQFKGTNTTTTIITTIDSITTQFVTQQYTTTVNNVQVTTIVTTIAQGGTTVTQNYTTTVGGSGGTSADLPVAIVGVVIAVIAGALSVFALRKH